jgi:AcrR family transcriptional regulator
VNELTGGGRTDGRTARRDRNRDTVLDAMIALIEEGEISPKVAQISERSGVSHRSVYRYFSDLDELFSEAVLRAYLRYAKLSVIHGFGRGRFDDRVRAIVDQRLVLWDSIAPLARSARGRAHAVAPMEAALTQYMAPMRDQIEVHFAPEIDAVAPAARARTVTAVELLLSFDGFEFLIRQGHDHAEIG